MIGIGVIIAGILLFVYSFNKQREESDLYNDWPFIGAISSIGLLIFGIILIIAGIVKY